jgi:hypothetical protein
MVPNRNKASKAVTSIGKLHLANEIVSPKWVRRDDCAHL